jgi:ketosteroid isomerase-like protein
MQTREGVLTMLDTAATCGAAATAGMACGALTVASGDPAAIAATRRTIASGRNLRMTSSFLVRFRSDAVEEAHDAPI